VMVMKVMKVMEKMDDTHAATFGRVRLVTSLDLAISSPPQARTCLSPQSQHTMRILM